jgi:tetratricopeptide (TPR) repeat protein
MFDPEEAPMRARSRLSAPASWVVLLHGLLCFTLITVSDTAASRPDRAAAWRGFEAAMQQAETAREDGDFEAAERSYHEAIELAGVFGEGNLRTGRAADGLADLYALLDRHDEAEAFYLRALEIWERTIGPEQPRTATTIHNLAASYLARGEPERAEPLFRRSLEIWERTLGAESLQVAVSLEANAAVLQRTGRGDEATSLIERARRIRDGKGGGG